MTVYCQLRFHATVYIIRGKRSLFHNELSGPWAFAEDLCFSDDKGDSLNEHFSHEAWGYT